MISWIIENLSTLIVSAVLIAAVTAIIVSMVRGRKKGKSSCGCGCADCSLCSACHSGNTTSQNFHSESSNTPQ